MRVHPTRLVPGIGLPPTPIAPALTALGVTASGDRRSLGAMSDYEPPLDDIRFLLEQVTPIGRLVEARDRTATPMPTPSFGVLDEFGRLMSEVWAPTNDVGDHRGQPRRGRQVHHADRLQGGLPAVRAAGWGAVPFDEAYGGGGFPWLVGIVMQEMLNSANMALAMAPLLTQGAIDALAPPRQRGADARSTSARW